MILEAIAAELGLPRRFVANLARSASHEYKTYRIAKRSGGGRIIHHPSRRLKALQRWLLVNVVAKLPVHPAAAAYRRVHSILDNAQSHAIRQYLLRMDFVDFFGSITRDDIVRYITENAVHFTSWTGEDVELFCRLVCRTDALTIGAPTSPALSNVVCYELDVRLHAVAERHGATYARYADDLFFSTSAKDILVVVEKRVQEMVRDLELPGNLRINESKTGIRQSAARGALLD